MGNIEQERSVVECGVHARDSEKKWIESGDTFIFFRNISILNFKGSPVLLQIDQFVWFFSSSFPKPT